MPTREPASTTVMTQYFDLNRPETQYSNITAVPKCRRLGVQVRLETADSNHSPSVAPLSAHHL